MSFLAVISVCCFISVIASGWLQYGKNKNELIKITYTAVLSFTLIALIGGGLGYHFQTEARKQEVNFELLKSRIEHRELLISELSSLIDRRYYATQAVLWSIEEGNYANLESEWRLYSESVRLWNENVYKYQSQLRLLVNDDVAAILLTYTDDLNNDTPQSIHYKFFRINQELTSFRSCSITGLCDINPSSKEINDLLQSLNDRRFELIGEVEGGIKELQNRYVENSDINQ